MSRSTVLALVASAGLVGAGGVSLQAGSAVAATAVSPAAVGARPNATRVEFRIGDRVQASVDVGTGNLMVSTTDLTLPGIGQDVQLGQTFNSLLLGSGSSLKKGSSGYGWAARLGADSKLIVNDDASIVYLAPGGLQGKYVPAGASGYTTPAGFKNTLTKTGTTGWSLTEHESNTVSTFTATGRLSKITDRNGQATTLSYNANGQVVSLSSTRGGANAKKVTIATNSRGLIGSMTQASDTSGSRSVSYTYVGDQLAKLTDAQGRVTTFGYTGATSGAGGDLTSITNTGGVATTFGYDSSHRVISVSRANPGKAASVTRFAYPSSTSSLVADPNTDQAQPVPSVPRTTYTVDASKRVTQAVDPLGRTRSSSYTPFGDVASASSPGGGTATFDYGANAGQSLTKVTSATGASMTLSYTGTGAGQYLPDGITDSQGNAGTVTYDGLGNQTGSTNTASAATASVTYHADGVLASSTDPAGKTTSYSRDAGTRQITGITPPAGAGLGSTALTYDGYARLVSVTDGRGVTTTYTYDQLDRVTGISYSGGPYGTPPTAPIGYTYDAAGNLTTRTDASGTTTYGYDGLGRLTSRQHTAGGGILSYGYDRAGNITSFGNTRGATAYVYDTANQLIQRTEPQYHKDYYAYNPDGKRTDTWWRANTTKTQYAARTHTDYDKNGRVARTWTSRNSSDTTRVFDTSYCYSPYAAGNPCPTAPTSSDTSLIQWSVDNLTGARSIYSYDGANRLTQVSNYHGHTYTYAYDKNGNRTSTKTDGTTTQTLTFNAGNQITTSGYSFDAAGNQTSDPAAGAIQYNRAGQMTAAHGASNQYTYAGPGQNELIRQDLPGSVRHDYVYGIDTPNGVPTLDQVAEHSSRTYIDNDPTTGQPQAITLPSGTEGAYLAIDGNGSIVALISSTTGNPVTGTYTYDPYGTITATTGTGPAVTKNPYRHTAGILDTHTSWTRHGTRYNDTTTGRFTTTDPITRLIDPNNANPYTYAACNPTNYTDPTGRDINDAIATGICAAGGLTLGVVGIAPGIVITIGCGIIGIGTSLT